MIETMIAVFVLSIGLLAIAGLQLNAKRASHQAWQRTLAVSLANDVLERIRMNPGEAAAYHTGTGSNGLGGGSITSAPTDCATTSCTPAESAAWDLWQWEQRLDGATVTDDGGNSLGGLIEPRGCIVFDDAGGGMVNTGSLRVIVTWRGTVETSDAVASGGVVCGTGTAGSDASRRQVSLTTYVYDDEDLYP